MKTQGGRKNVNCGGFCANGYGWLTAYRGVAVVVFDYSRPYSTKDEIGSVCSEK